MKGLVGAPCWRVPGARDPWAPLNPALLSCAYLCVSFGFLYVLCIGKEVIQGCMSGSRNRGRQRRRWTDDISEWTGMAINDAARVAKDRVQRRGLLRAANPLYRGRHRLIGLHNVGLLYYDLTYFIVFFTVSNCFTNQTCYQVLAFYKSGMS